jgi:hypothetical protein
MSNNFYVRGHENESKFQQYDLKFQQFGGIWDAEKSRWQFPKEMEPKVIAYMIDIDSNSETSDVEPSEDEPSVEPSEDEPSVEPSKDVNPKSRDKKIHRANSFNSNDESDPEDVG